MFETLESIEALLGVEEESVSLEFKDGAKLTGLTDKAKTELITDVTAFANAGGGTVIYGIKEEQRDGKSVASAIAPVTDVSITQDRLRDIIHSNTDPAMRGFSIVRIGADGGSIFVIEVAEGDTAYQNKRDFKFYDRVDASAHPMYAFAVRDVMNRRTHPHVSVKLKIYKNVVEQGHHRYTVVPELTNEGNLTANLWSLRVGVPEAIGQADGLHGFHMREINGPRLEKHRLRWFEYSSERNHYGSLKILPGDTVDLSSGNNYPSVLLDIKSVESLRSIETAPPLFWSLLLDNAPRQSGRLPYAEWSIW